MWNSVAYCFSNYARFRGRARRPEYWWFYCFVLLVNVPIYALVDVAPRVGVALSWVWVAASLLPFLAALSRRLHDTGHSFWWAGVPLLALVLGVLARLLWPAVFQASVLARLCSAALVLGLVVVAIRVIILLCSRGDAAANRYGDPAPVLPR